MKYLLENSPKNSHTWARHIYNLAELYEIEDPLETMKKVLPSKIEYSRNVLIKITAYHEKLLRMKSSTNSKMSYLNISLNGLNGRCHPALHGIKTTKNVQSMRPHIKMLSGDYYTYKLRSEYLGGTPYCRLCLEPPSKTEKIEDLEHILTECGSYTEVRKRILCEMEEICAHSKTQLDFKLILKNPAQLTQFILDCCSLNLPSRISSNDPIFSSVYQLSRDLCFSINKTRLNKLKVLKLLKN